MYVPAEVPECKGIPTTCYHWVQYTRLFEPEKSPTLFRQDRALIKYDGPA